MIIALIESCLKVRSLVAIWTTYAYVFSTQLKQIWSRCDHQFGVACRNRVSVPPHRRSEPRHACSAEQKKGGNQSHLVLCVKVN